MANILDFSVNTLTPTGTDKILTVSEDSYGHETLDSIKTYAQGDLPTRLTTAEGKVTTLETSKADASEVALKANSADVYSKADFETSTTPLSTDKILAVTNGVAHNLSMPALVDYITGRQGAGSWQDIVDMIDANTFKDAYANGDAIVSTYTDGSTVYEMPFIVVDNNKTVETINGDTLTHRVILQPMYLSSWSQQFSQYRAFLRCPEGLVAGTYYVTFAQAWSKLTSDMLQWNFTITQDVPVGGRIAGFRGFADSQSATSIYVYGADGKTIQETVTCSQGASGTSLGTMNYTTRNGNLNGMQETFYGLNEYELSAVMQRVDGLGTDWWKPSDGWDCAPSNVDNNGYLSYLDPALVGVLKTIKVKTAHNNVQGQSSIFSEAYHRAWLPSLEEMYIRDQGAGEGEVLPYWQTRNDTGAVHPWYTSADTYKIYCVNSTSSPDYYWLRSATRNYSYNAWYVNPSGSVSGDNARRSRRVAPLVCI